MQGLPQNSAQLRADKSNFKMFPKAFWQSYILAELYVPLPISLSTVGVANNEAIL